MLLTEYPPKNPIGRPYGSKNFDYLCGSLYVFVGNISFIFWDF